MSGGGRVGFGLCGNGASEPTAGRVAEAGWWKGAAVRERADAGVCAGHGYVECVTCRGSGYVEP